MGSGGRELALDFVVHDHGVAGVWARDAEAGDALVVMGPRANWLLPEDYRHYLAVGDETALPAISRVLEEAPAGTVVTAVVEVADAGEEQELTPAEDVVADLRWVHRDTAEVGTGHLSALETAVRAVPLPEDLTSLFVFAAGETGAMKPIRRYLRREVGLEKDQVAVDGYWKRGSRTTIITPNHSTTDIRSAFSDMTDIIAPFLLRGCCRGHSRRIPD